MIRFKTFLEKKLPKSLTLHKVRHDNYGPSLGYEGHPKLTEKEKKFWNKYINLLNKYVTDYVSAPFLVKSRDKIPAKYRKAPDMVYRGLVVDEEGFKQMLKTGIHRNNEESWTSKKKIGIDFAIKNEDRDYGQNMALTIAQKIPSKYVVLNVREFAQSKEIADIGAAIEHEDFDTMADFLSKLEHEIIVAGKEMKPIKLSDKTMTFWWWDPNVEEWEKLKLDEMKDIVE